MRTILGVLFLIASFMGYSLYIKEKFKVNTAFIPFIIVSSYIFIIAISARLSLMLLSIIIINIIGLFLLFKGLRKKELYKKLFPEYPLFFIVIIILAIYLNGKKFFLYDDFSHWATIARLLIEKDAINTSKDSVVTFMSYPQSSAYFIYGIVRFLSYPESNMMIANSIIALSGAFCFLSINNNKIINYIISVLIIIFVLMYDIRPYGLLVDTMLASTAFAVFSFVFNLSNSNNKNLKFFVIPMLISLLYLKNSGLLFALFILIYMIFKFWSKDKAFVFLNVFIVFIANRSWANYISNEFGYTGKHSMNLSSYRKVFETNKEYISEFREKFLNNIINDKFMWTLLAVLIILLILIKRKEIIVKLILATIIIYAIYQVGNYFMYISSMTVGELRRLACYDRYVRTIHIFIILINLYVLNYFFDEKMYIKFFTILLLIYSTFILEKPEELGIKDSSFREKLNEEKIKNNIEKDKKVLVKFKERDFSRIYTRATMFEFNTAKVKDTFPGDKKSYNPDDYDYVIDLSK